MTDMGTFSIALAWAVSLLLAYAVISRGLFQASDQFRHEAVEIARGIFQDPEATDHEKAIISSALDDFHSKLAAWRLVGSTFLYLVTVPAKWFGRREAEVSITGNPLREPAFDAFILRWSVSTVANSPITALLFAILVILTAALTMTGKVMGRVLFTHTHHDGHGSNGGQQVAHG